MKSLATRTAQNGHHYCAREGFYGKTRGVIQLGLFRRGEQSMKKVISILSGVMLLSSGSKTFSAISDIKKIGQDIVKSVSAVPGEIKKELTGDLFKSEKQKKKEAAEKKRVAEQKRIERQKEQQKQEFEKNKGRIGVLRVDLRLQCNKNIRDYPLIKAIIANDLAKLKSVVESQLSRGVFDPNRRYEVSSTSDFRYFDSKYPLLFFADSWDIVEYLMSKGARYEGFKSYTTPITW